jgi:hypothetical protein
MLAGNAAYDPGATWLIQRVNGTGSSAVITFSNIPQTYQHLQIRGLYSTNGWGVALTFNGNTSANYARHRLRGDGSAASAAGSSSRSNVDLDSGGSGAGQFTGIILDIHDYTSTSKNKTIRVISGQELNGTGGRIDLLSGLWINTSAITSITLTADNSEPFTTTSTFALYGFKGA